MGNCCKKDSKYATYKKELGAPLLKEMKQKGLPEGTKVIVVKLISISDLDGADITGSANPYVEFTLKPDTISDGQLQRSTAKSRTTNPKWEPHERFQFIVANMESSRIVISCYHRFSQSNTKVLGDAVLSTKDVSTTSNILKLKLINSSGKFKGEIELEVVQMEVDKASSIEEHRVYEYQRWQPVVLWGSDFPGHFLPTDPGRWSSADGSKFGNTFADVEPPLEEGWTIVSQWTTTLSIGDVGGWQYAVDFKAPSWFEEQGFGMYVRRRVWTREVAYQGHDDKIPS